MKRGVCLLVSDWEALTNIGLGFGRFLFSVHLLGRIFWDILGYFVWVVDISRFIPVHRLVSFLALALAGPFTLDSYDMIPRHCENTAIYTAFLRALQYTT
jgi:hypothetical protein